MQFRHLRDGDRFFFLVDDALSEDEKAAIQATRLSDVIRRNTTMSQLQANVFMAPLKDTWMDLDHDGVADIREVIAGTDPGDASSALRVLTLDLEDGAAVLQWASVPGKSYIIQHATTLGAAWMPMASLTAVSSEASARLPKLGAGQGFYRVAVSR